MPNPERGARVTMKAMPDLMRRLRTGAALGRVDVIASGHDVGETRRGLRGLEPKVISPGQRNYQVEHVIECRFQGGWTFSIPLTRAWFKPRLPGEVVAYYRTNGYDIIVTYVMPEDRVGTRHIRFRA